MKYTIIAYPNHISGEWKLKNSDIFSILEKDKDIDCDNWNNSWGKNKGIEQDIYQIRSIFKRMIPEMMCPIFIKPCL